MGIRVDRQFRIARIWSNREIKKLAPLFTGDVVNISAGNDKDKEGGYYKEHFANASGYYYTNYIGDRGYKHRKNEYFVDLTKDLPAELEKRFDVVFNHTTLEHIFDIKRAFRNLCEMTKDIAIIIVPFSQIQHDRKYYKDYWRFAPSCIRELFRENEMEVVYESESNYKKAAIYLLFVASRYPRKWKERMPKYEPITEAGRSIGFQWSLKKLKRKVLRGR
ncbi:MAG: hypothetical protein ABSG99_06065 [Sedimentisphaerales bacterium]